MRVLVVTAANEGFVPLLRGLIASLEQWTPRPFTALACFDLGLAPASRRWLGEHAAHIVEPGWDVPVREKTRVKSPELRSMTVRPFLPDYFPGYEMYLWIDGDAWVQERYALEWFVAAASDGAIAMAPHHDRAYQQTPDVIEWRVECMRAYFGRKAGQRAAWDAYYNTGVFALRAGAPHWKVWAKRFEEGLTANRGKLVYDQNPINYAIWMDRLPVAPLPAVCNWLCHLALPAFDSVQERFCEPFLPRQPIGILHLTAKTKDLKLEVPDANGARELSLRFRDSTPA